MLHGRHRDGPMHRVEKPRGITRLHPGVFIRGKEGDTASIPCSGNTDVCDRACFERPCGARHGKKTLLLIINPKVVR